jgi:uncharacterized protein YciW
MDPLDRAVTRGQIEHLIAERERMREALDAAETAMAEIAQDDEEGEFTLARRATRAAELAHMWLLRHGVHIQ